MAALKSRRTVRKFTPDPVPPEAISRILDTSRYAPSASNVRPVKWLHLHGRPVLEEIAGMTAAAIEDLPNYGTFSKMWKMGVDLITRGASSCILSYADDTAAWAVADSAIAITYAEISAHAMGLGSCWGGLVTRAARTNPDISRYLGLPEGHSVTGALFLGFPAVVFHRLPPREEPDIRIVTGK